MEERRFSLRPLAPAESMTSEEESIQKPLPN
jgi:hypothetical protein